jgi:hypothetical protein
MPWGEVELEPEVRTGSRRWAARLGRGWRSMWTGRPDEGPLLTSRTSRQLDGKLRESRFCLAGVPVRVTYWIAPGWRIILLTVFPKAP